MTENIIKKTCKELGITQKELAETLGLNINTVSQWARGVTPIPQWALITMPLMIKEKVFNSMFDSIEKLKEI